MITVGRPAMIGIAPGDGALVASLAGTRPWRVACPGVHRQSILRVDDVAVAIRTVARAARAHLHPLRPLAAVVALPWSAARAAEASAVQTREGTQTPQQLFPRFWGETVLGPRALPAHGGGPSWKLAADAGTAASWRDACARAGVRFGGVLPDVVAVARGRAELGERPAERLYQHVAEGYRLEVHADEDGGLLAARVLPMSDSHDARENARATERWEECACVGARLLALAAPAALLMPPSRPYLERSTSTTRVLLAAAAFAAALLAAAAAPGVAAHLSAEDATMDATLPRVSRLLDSLDALTRRNRQVQGALTGGFAASALLASIARSLPDAAELVSVHLGAADGALVVVAHDPAQLVHRLAESGVVALPTLTGPVVPVVTGNGPADGRVRMVVRFTYAPAASDR